MENGNPNGIVQEFRNLTMHHFCQHQRTCYWFGVKT